MTNSRREALLAGVLLVALAAVAAAALVAPQFGDAGAPRDATEPPPTATPAQRPPSGADTGALTTLWLSDTGRDVGGNHHAAVGGRVDGRTLVFAPISGTSHDHGAGHDSTSGRRGTATATAHAHGDASAGCALVALNGTTGSVRWRRAVPPANCTIHAVADPTLADADADGRPEVLAPSTRRAVSAYDPLTGTVEFRHDLSTYGYTRPLVADFVGDATPETVVVDVKGTVFVVAANGTTVWRRDLSAYVWGQPHVGDVDADGRPELAVGLASGEVHLLDPNGTTAWRRPVADNDVVTWTTTGQTDDDPALEVVVATVEGRVAVFDGATGTVAWQRDLGNYSAVHALGDGDRDGSPEVYATARDGTLRALAGADGTVEWTTRLTTADVQMTPPPVLADVDADGRPEIVAATNDGRVVVVSPATGEVVASHRRNASVWTHPTLADVAGDDRPEVLVMYGDGRVAALSYGPAEADDGQRSS